MICAKLFDFLGTFLFRHNGYDAGSERLANLKTDGRDGRALCLRLHAVFYGLLVS